MCSEPHLSQSLLHSQIFTDLFQAERLYFLSRAAWETESVKGT